MNSILSLCWFLQDLNKSYGSRVAQWKRVEATKMEEITPKKAKTAAERMKAYRARKRLENSEFVEKEKERHIKYRKQKAVAATAEEKQIKRQKCAERVQKCRLAKKASKMVTNTYSKYQSMLSTRL